VVSVHISFLHLADIESVTLVAFITCVVIRSLCLQVKPITIPIACVIQITESFKTAYDFLLDFLYFITDVN